MLGESLVNHQGPKRNSAFRRWNSDTWLKQAGVSPRGLRVVRISVGVRSALLQQSGSRRARFTPSTHGHRWGYSGPRLAAAMLASSTAGRWTL